MPGKHQRESSMPSAKDSGRRIPRPPVRLFCMALVVIIGCGDSGVEDFIPALAGAVADDNQVEAVQPARPSAPESSIDKGVSEGHMRTPIPPPEVIAQLPPDGGPNFNRLVFQQSPYLLQHARNPVDWYPWGEDAFTKARRENKLVFLSIGYSTCHWCHVMERESFENEEVAALMNQSYVSIKVDREERPDLDEIYMTVTQAMTGSGGWPMTVILTSEKKPIFAGTYFPKEGRFGRPGMMDLLPQIASQWAGDRDKLLQSADRITQYLQQASVGTPGEALGKKVLDTAYTHLKRSFDSRRGGFGQAPKFPTPHRYTFLLRQWRRSGDAEALKMVEKTLSAMRRGGMYDHMGFGFHRYSTDPDWLVPHFEKMLYDQALLAIAFTETYQATAKKEYADTVREIFTYVLRDMTAPEGGFYSAEDADSEGEEGKFYVWTEAEIASILGDQEAGLYIRVHNTSARGNWNEGRKHQTNILHTTSPTDEIAKKEGMSVKELRARMEAARQKLFEVREKRVHPYKDDKILTDWNGLMIAALAKGARALDEPLYAAAAEKSAAFFLGRMRAQDGRLIHRYRQGQAGLPAQQEDYAFFVWGLLELYETTFKTEYLETALELNDLMLKHYWDEAKGGFYLSADDGEKLLVRPKTIYDGAIPSGNSVAALNLLRLGRMTGRSNLEAKAEEVMKAFAGDVRRNPSAYTQLLNAVDFGVGPSYEVVIAGTNGDEHTESMIRTLRASFIPNKVVLFRPDGDASPAITRLAEFTQNQKSLGGKATAYVCLNYACKAPTTDIPTMMKSLGI